MDSEMERGKEGQREKCHLYCREKERDTVTLRGGYQDTETLRVG